MKVKRMVCYCLSLLASLVVCAQSQSASPAATNLTLFGRDIYPGDDSTYEMIRQSGFTTFILSSFYIRANGDVYSGDDSKNPIIHNGMYVGNPDWLARVASLKTKSSGITRIEILLEGRWYNQPPNTYDFIKEWASDTSFRSASPDAVPGTSANSTLYGIVKVLKEKIGVDAICIDDESVYDSPSIIALGQITGKLNMHMTLCPFTNKKYWKEIIDGSEKGLVDAVYLQCYDGGAKNTIGPWHDSLLTNVPVYPIFLCRGAFSTCQVNHNSKSPDEIKNQMKQFKKEYPGMRGGAIWQMSDIKSYVRMNCATQDASSGSATSVREYIQQLRKSLKAEL